MDTIFFKVWRNIVIRNEIFKHLVVKHKPKRIFFIDTKQLYESLVKRGEHQYVKSIGFTGKDVFINGYKIPDTITSLDIGNKVIKDLEIGDIPLSITELIIGRNYNKTFKTGVIPNSVTKITIGQMYNQPINPNDLPDSITSLKFVRNSKFNQYIIEYDLPSGIKEITFSDHFKKELNEGDIPESVTKLSFKHSYRNFSGPISYLPNTLTSLTIEGYSELHKDFYQVPSILPNSLTELNIQIPEQRKPPQLHSDFIPKRVTSLRISTFSISGILPPSLTKLVYGYYDNALSFFGWGDQPILPNDLPSTLTHLEFGCRFNQPIDCALPDSLQYLSFCTFYHPLPFAAYSNKFNHPLPLNVLKSNNLHTLILGSNFNQLISSKDVSESLTTLHYYPRKSQLIQVQEFKSVRNVSFIGGFNGCLNINYFSPCITSVDFGSYFNTKFSSEDLPSTLVKISFGDAFSQTLPRLPPLVKSIKFGKSYNKTIPPNVLPNSLKTIEFGHSFNKPFAQNVLPLSLETIIVGTRFKQEFNKLNLPPSLISFVYSN